MGISLGREPDGSESGNLVCFSVCVRVCVLLATGRGNCPIIEKNQKCFILILIFQILSFSYTDELQNILGKNQYNLPVFVFVCRYFS